jgi:uncharacterized protein (DUF58 family)
MIAPRLRFVLLMLLVSVPLATAAGLSRGLLPFSLLLIALAVVAALFDLALGLGRYRSLDFAVPEVVLGILAERTELEVRAKYTALKTEPVRLAVLFPDGLDPGRNETLFRPGKANDPVRIPFVARSRGSYHIRSIYFDWLSPLGLWVHRECRTVQCEVRIYPNLRFEGRRVARFLKRGAIGAHARPQTGRGREFEKLREYEEGDGFDEIHWKATAKRRFPVTKVFQLERSQEIYIAVDTSRLSARSLPEPFSGNGTGQTTTHLDRAISAALLLCIAAERQGDRFGLLCFSDRVNHLLKARSGLAHFRACRELTLSLFPQTVSPDFGEIMATVRNRIKRRSLFVFLTSLDDPVIAEDFIRAVELLSRQHLLLAITIAPIGVQPLFDKNGVEEVDEIYSRLGGHLKCVRLQNLQRVLARKGAQFHVVPNQEVGLRLVSDYMNLKRRQLL